MLTQSARIVLWFLVFAISTSLSPAAPYTLVSGGAHDFTLREPKVFWHTGARCIPSPDNGPPIGAADPEIIRRIASSGGNTRTLLEENDARPADVCNPYHIYSNILADDDYLYWVDDSGLVRLSTDANAGDPVELLSASITGGNDSRRAELAHDSESIYAKTYNGLQSRIWEVSKTSGNAVVRRTTNTAISRLSTDGQYVYWIESGRLKRTKFGAISLVLTIAEGVTGYHAEGYRKGFGVISDTDYVFIAQGRRIIRYNNLTGDTSAPLYTSDDPDAVVYSLVTVGGGGFLVGPGTGLFFLERRPYEDPEPPHFINYNQYVVRTGRSGSNPAFLYVKNGTGPGIIDVNHLTTNGSYLFWQDGDRVLRLPNNAAAMPEINLMVLGLEVTQGIQDLANSVDLIENRRTFARFYVRSTIDSGEVQGVTAKITATANGHVSLGTIWPVNSVGTKLTLRPEPLREEVNHSFLFELPWSWTTQSDLRLRAELNPTQVPIETAYGDNVLTEGPFNFKPSPRFEPQFIIWRYEVNGTLFSPRNVEDVQETYSWFRRAYPLASAPGSASDPTPGFRPRDRIVYDGALHLFVTRNAGICGLLLDPKDFSLCANVYTRGLMDAWKVSSGDQWTVYYGMIRNHPNFFVRGATSGLTSGGPCGPAWSWETDTTFGDWYAGHEIGHALGRGHPYEAAAECGHDPADSNYPYEDGYIGGTLNPTLEGFDISEVNHDHRVLPSSTWRDFMTYCEPLWISDYTYNALYDVMLNLQGFGQAAGARGAGGGPALAPKTPGDWLGVFGMMRLDADKAVISQLMHVGEVGWIPPAGRGEYSVQLLGAGEAILAELPFTPLKEEESQGLLASFSVVIPFAPGSSLVRIVRLSDDRTLAEKTISEHAPEITALDIQHAGEPVQNDITLSWTASDPDGGELSFDILFSRGGGGSFEPLQWNVKGSSAKVDTREMPGGMLILRLVATDGVHRDERDTEPFEVAAKPPQPRILSPSDGLRIQYGQLVNFSGEARDLQDGSVGGRSLTWYRGRTILGRGPLLSRDDLPVGVNTIRLGAANSAGLSASADVTVIVHDDLRLPGPIPSVVPAQLSWKVSAGTQELQTAVVQITNVGSGTLHWTARIEGDRVSVSESSGTAPSSLTVLADPSGLEDRDSVKARLVVQKEDDPEQSFVVPVSLSVGCLFCDGPRGGGETVSFLRGDTKGDGNIDISDGIYVFNYLFLGSTAPGCLRAADADNSEKVDISDGIYILNFLFLGGPPPAAPYPGCGAEPGPPAGGLPCETQPGCL